jgi:hypothetical protein
MKTASNKMADLFQKRSDDWEYLDSHEIARKFTQEELITLSKAFNDALHHSLTGTV